MADPRASRAWRKLRDQVVVEEPVCYLRLPGICTYWSQTADHVVPVAVGPDLAMERENLRGICHPCNRRRSDTPLEELVEAFAPALGFFG